MEASMIFVGLRLPEELKEELDALAEGNGVSFSQVARLLLQEGVDRINKQVAKEKEKG